LHVLRVLDDLQRIAPVLCARGNGDHPDPFNPKRPGVPEDPRVRESHVLTLEGWTLGLTHGFPAPDEPAWQDISRAMRHYFGRMVDIVVCGDTHMEQVHERDGVLFVNPGSPTLPRQVRRLGTVAVLEVGQGFRRASIKNLGIVSA
jgi:putative phosphoesterase